MKANLLKVVLAVILVGCVLMVLFHLRHIPEVQPQVQAPVTNQITFQPADKRALAMRASDLTPEQKAEFEKRFKERIKPAINKWANAYAGHLPFDPSVVTVDNFHSVSQGGFFTFMIGADTFTVFDTAKETKVFYYMAKQAALDLNNVPKDGIPRNLITPIKSDEVLKMATADTGLKYELKDVVIKPTATYCNIDGGADVEVGIKYQNGMMLVEKNNLSFVMDSNGMIVSYQH